ncbi:MAG: hypothetical protein QXX12_04000 [Nanopusillaceae archaeon]
MSETLEREILPRETTITVTEELTLDYTVPTTTPTLTPPLPPTPTPTTTPVTRPPTQIPTPTQAFCSQVTQYEDLGNNLRLYRISGNPLVIVDPTISVSVSIMPESSVICLYPLICGNYWFCGFRAGVLITCYGGTCAVTLTRIGNSEIPDNVALRTYGDLEYLSISIRSKEETQFGFGALIWYLVIHYRMTDGFETEVEIPLWSWTLGPGTEFKDPYPIEVYLRPEGTVYDCGQLSVSRCPWAGSWHSPVSCALWEFFRFMWDSIYKILPQPVKDFFNFIYGLVGAVGSVLSFVVNPMILTLFLSLVLFVFVFYFIYLMIESGPAGVFEFIETVKSFIGSIVEWIIKLIQTLKP